MRRRYQPSGLRGCPLLGNRALDWLQPKDRVCSAFLLRGVTLHASRTLHSARARLPRTLAGPFDYICIAAAAAASSCGFSMVSVLDTNLYRVLLDLIALTRTVRCRADTAHKAQDYQGFL